MRYLVTLVLLLTSLCVVAQTQQSPPSLKAAFSQPVPAPTLPNWMQDTGSTDDKKPTCCFGCIGGDIKYNLFFDSRQTFFAGQRARMNGFKIGAELYEKVRFGLGFYNLQRPLDISERIDDSQNRTRELDFRYNTSYVEYIAYRDFRWELSLPVQFGRGTGTVDTLNVAGQRGLERTDNVNIISVGAAGYIRVIPWFGIGSGVGYVWAISDNQAAEAAFSSPYYSIRAKIFLGYLIKSMIFPKKVEAERDQYRRERDARRNRNSL